MTNTLITSTKNTSFEEVFNFLTYESSSTRMKCFHVVPTTNVRQVQKVLQAPSTALTFSGVRIISYPNLTMMARRFVQDFPDEIEIKVKGYIDETGHAQITTVLPEAYQKFVHGKESIDFCSNKTIKVSLRYYIVPSTEEGFLGSIKNKAYNGMTASMESFFTELYQEKRKACFNAKPVVKIQNIEELRKQLKPKL